MAQFLNHINLNGNELQNFLVQPLGAAPTTALKLGRKYFDTADGREQIYNGSKWLRTAYMSDLEAVSAITSKMVTDALGFTPFDSAAFTKTSIQNALGIADWALAANKPSYNFSEIAGRPTHLSQFTDDVVAGKYLPLTGGTIKGASPYHQYVLTLNTDNVYYTILRLNNRGTQKGYLAWADDDAYFEGIFISNTTTKDVLGLSDYGVPMYNKNTLIHSGNIGEYAVMEAEAASTFVLKFGYSASGVDFNSLTSGGMLANFGDTKVWKNAPSGMSYGAGINFKAKDYSYLSGQLAWDVNHDGTTDTTRYLWWRADDSHAFANAKWHQIAFIDSTVDKAKILVDANNAYLIYKSSAGNFMVGDNIYQSGDTHILGNNIHLRYGISASYGFILNSSGNVTIGSGDYAGTDYKFRVQGKGYFNNDLHLVNWAYLRSFDTSGNSHTLIGLNNANQVLVNEGTDVPTIIRGGNVGIGTASPQYNLDVAGTVRISTSITLKDKTITSWDDLKASGDYLPLTGGELSGPLTVNGKIKGSALDISTTLGSILFSSNILYVNASLQIGNNWVLRLAGEGITSWAGLKTILGLKALAYKDSIAFSEITSKPTTLNGYGITDAYTRAQVDALIANVEGGSGSGTGNITIDSALSETSVNPVQNNVITANINSINASLTSVNTTLGSLKSLAYKDKVNWNTDIENIPDDLGGEIKVVSQTATSGTVDINPNVLNKWTTPLTGTLTINFSAGSTGVANYYMIEFKTGSSVPTISLPSGITWQNGDNILARLEPNKTYQISVLNNLAVGGAF